MKRIISLALVVLAVAAMLVACGGSSSPEGKYVVKSIDGQAVEDAVKQAAEAAGMSAEDFLKELGVASAEEIVTLELKSDSTAVMAVNMFSTTVEGTWKQDGNKITLTIDGTDGVFTLSGNELSGDDGDQAYVFVKK